MNYIISQILGVLVTVVCLISPQMKKKWQMCCITILANVMSATGMLLVGAFSAMGCCIVAIVQTALRIWHLHKDTKISKTEIGIFSVLYIVGGFLPYIVGGTLSEFGFIDVLPIIGALMLMVGVALRGEQPSRVCGLINGIIYFVYNLIIWNTQIFAQLAGIVSNVIALIRYRKKEKDAVAPEVK